MYQDEMKSWLEEERERIVSTSTISRMLKRNSWSRKSLQVISQSRSSVVRSIYLNDMAQYTAEEMVFLDETIFTEKTGWRAKAYAPIGEAARYSTSVRRGKTYSCLAAMGIGGWLPCWELREGYWKHEDFAQWIREQLIPCINGHFGGRRMVIIMDNCSTHVRPIIQEIIHAAGHLIKYLPPYSPDFNPIELTFGVLKAFLRRNFWLRREEFDDFIDYLAWCIEES